MTVAYDPRQSWASEDVARQPVRELGAGHLFDGDLCDVTTDHRYCHDEAVTVAVSASGETRLLCAGHKALYFPVEI